MEKVLIRKKGYTLEVVSWENDGDNYRTKYKTVKTKEEAEKLYKICTELFGNSAVGNSVDGEADETIKEYIKEHHEFKLTKDEIFNLSYDLMGASEYYDFRVCESVIVTYLEEDVYATSVNF